MVENSTTQAAETGKGETMTYEVIGYRFIDKFYQPEPTVGQVLDASRVWDGETPTDEELSGTCAFSTRVAVEKYAQWSKGTGWIVTIGGDDAGSCGEMAGEILVANAMVIAVEAW